MPSTVIHDFAYDADSEELTIEFKTGRIYLYFSVPEDEFAGFCAASSRGGYFNRHIRDRYVFREVTPV
jgi:lysyl-tRNA synthetase class 2